MAASMKKKYGPLSAGSWIAVGGAALGVAYFIRSRSKSSAAAAATGIPGGNLPLGMIPSGTTIASTVSTGSQFGSLQEWQTALYNALLKTPTYQGNPNAGAGAFNAVSRWSNGQCVGKNQYNALSAVLPTIGLPPGFNAPPLTICTNAQGGNIPSTRALPTATGH